MRARLEVGFRWPGGAVADNPAYIEDAFVEAGFRSDEDPLLQLFVAKTRRAKVLVSGNRKDHAEILRSKILALDAPYVETSKEMLGVIRVELDRVFASWSALCAAIERTGAPCPNVAIAHVDDEGRVMRPHLIYLLVDSVAATGRARRRPVAAWRHALRALTALLLPAGADPGGISNPHRHKNPLSPLWSFGVLSGLPYTLSPGTRGFPSLLPGLPRPREVTEALRTAWAVEDEAIAADHPDPAVASASNRVWRQVCDLAQRIVHAHRDRGEGSRGEFEAILTREAASLHPATGSGERAAGKLAGHIAQTTWDRAQCERTPLSGQALTAAQSAGQAKGAASRRTCSAGLIRAAMQSILDRDGRITKAAVARESGRSYDTVTRHWDTVLKALENSRVQSAPDKKHRASMNDDHNGDGPSATPSRHRRVPAGIPLGRPATGDRAVDDAWKALDALQASHGGWRNPHGPQLLNRLRELGREAWERQDEWERSASPEARSRHRINMADWLGRVARGNLVVPRATRRPRRYGPPRARRPTRRDVAKRWIQTAISIHAAACAARCEELRRSLRETAADYRAEAERIARMPQALWRVSAWSASREASRLVARSREQGMCPPVIRGLPDPGAGRTSPPRPFRDDRAVTTQPGLSY